MGNEVIPVKVYIISKFLLVPPKDGVTVFERAFKVLSSREPLDAFGFTSRGVNVIGDGDTSLAPPISMPVGASLTIFFSLYKPTL